MLRKVKVVGMKKVKYLSDFTKLQPYMYKPRVSKESVKENYPGKEWSDAEEDASRTGNTLSCSFGKCKPMATQAEGISCIDKYEICESFFKGILSFVF